MPRQQASSNKKTFSSYTQSTNSIPRPQSPLAPPVPNTPNLPTQTIQVQPPGFFSSVIQGFGLGAGSSIAHNWFDNPKTVIHQNEKTPLTPKYEGPCAKQKEIFDKCISNRQSVEECERTLKDLRACYDEHESKSS